MQPTLRIAGLITALALAHGLLCARVAHASSEPSFPPDTGLRLAVAAIATPTFIIGDLVFLAEGSVPPLGWSALELLPAVGWLVVSMNDYDPNLNPAAAIFAGAFAVHAFASMLSYEPDKKPLPQNPPPPADTQKAHARVSPALWLDRHSVTIGVAERF